MRRSHFGRGSTVALAVGLSLLTALPSLGKNFAVANENIMYIRDDLQAVPGASFDAIVRLTHVEDVHGFQTVVIYENTPLTLTEMSTTCMDSELLLLPDTIEFLIMSVDPNIAPGFGWGATSAIFDFSLPFNGQVLPPGPDQSIVNYKFNVANDPALIGSCTVLDLDGTAGTVLKLSDGQVCFEDLDTFVRGDANNDSLVDLADVLFILNFLFDNGPPPECTDTADTNDDGNVEISDPIGILNFLFLQGCPPQAPFPECGPDSTPDNLNCLSAGC